MTYLLTKMTDTKNLMSISQRLLPTLYIDIEQPGDKGAFIIQVIDPKTRKTICTNKLPESHSSVHYMYASKLIERPRDALMASQQERMVKVDNRWEVRQKQRYDDIVRYGQRLYNDIFGNGRAFRRYVDQNSHLERGVKYVLRLHSTASELWNIPWEYMHDGERFLSIDGGSPITRRPQNIKLMSNSLRTASLPLRILVVISDPIDAPPLNVDHEITIIKNAVKPAEDKGLVIVDYVEEGSLYNLEIMLHEDDYHVLHYTGHGGMTSQGSCLMMENNEGRGEPVFINQLLPIIKQRNSLRLVVLSGCQTGMIDATQAMSGIATGLLPVVPAVVSMQFSILDKSAQVFAEVFYGEVGRGKTLDNAIHTTRMTMNQTNKSLADWGVPSLYAHEDGIRLITSKMHRAENKPRPKFDLDILPQPTTFVGRRDEQRMIRHILPNLNFSMAYIWGLSGMGKSALARRIIERPGRQGLVSSALVLHVGKSSPNDIVIRIADWLAADFPQAAAAFRDNRLKPYERVERAAQYVKSKRLVLVIDQFDLLLQETKPLHWDIKHPAIASFFYYLATAQWSVLTIFTSRYRWSYLSELQEGSFVESHLNAFNIADIQRMMAQFEYLPKAKFKNINTLFKRVGGHLQTIHTSEMLLTKIKKPDAIATERFIQMLGNHWHNTFMDAVLKYMSPEEHNALLKTCIIGDYFSPNQVQLMVGIESRQQAELYMAKWEGLSMANFMYADDDGTPWYRIPMIVRTYMMLKLDDNQERKLHYKATQVIAEDWFVLARERFIEYGGAEPDPDNKFQTALTEIAIIMSRASSQAASHYVSLAIQWREHFVKAMRQDEANMISLGVWEFIAFRFNDRDSAIEMLQEIIDTESKVSHHYAMARMGLATIQIDIGQWDEAIEALEFALKLFAELNDEWNQARTLSRLASAYFAINKSRKAKGLLDKALKLREILGDFNGGAKDLNDMARHARNRNDYKSALEYTVKAEHLLRQIENPDINIYANVLFERGLAFKGTKDYESAYNIWGKAIELYDHVGDTRGMAQTYEEAAEVLRLVESYDGAAHMILQAIDLAKQLDDEVNLPPRILILSMIYEDQKSYEEAYIQTERAIAIAERLSLPDLSQLRDSRRRLRRKTGRGLF